MFRSACRVDVSLCLIVQEGLISERGINRIFGTGREENRMKHITTFSVI